jgi:hypothetical protein
MNATTTPATERRFFDEEGKRERGIALFAVAHVEEMVRDLERAYDAGWQTARSSPASVDEQPRTVS